MFGRTSGFDYARAILSGVVFVVLFVLMYVLIVKVAYAPAMLKGDGPVDPLYPPLRTLDFFLLCGALLASIFGATFYFFLKPPTSVSLSGTRIGLRLGVLYAVCLILTIGVLIGFSSFVQSTLMDIVFLGIVVGLSTTYGYLLGK